MSNDIFFIFYWWLLLFGIGVIFFPLTAFLFQKFFDKGYLFSKILGILIISYLVWLLGSLKILPFLNETIWLVILATIAGNFFLFNKKREEFTKGVQNKWKIFLYEEIFFFLCLAVWSFIRGFQPDIQGLEKFMDYGFVNSILKSRFFPPADMWLSGETINYYYFGHLVSAILTRISGIDSAITYNLLVASLFALIFCASFSLGTSLFLVATSEDAHSKKNLKLAIISGLLTAFMLSLSGNLHPLWWYLSHKNFNNYWYPDATRFIVQLFGAADNTIHEFPLYSYVVADLHGHFLNLPLVLLFLALILKIFSDKKISLIPLTLISLLLGVFYITNAWDFPIYSLILGFTIFYFNYLKSKFKLKTFTQTFLLGGGSVLLALVFSLPFHLNFKSIAEGIKPVDFHSPPWMLLVLWGFPLFNSLVFLVFLLLGRKDSHRQSPNLDYLILILLGVSWFLILVPEIFYIKDIYIHSYQRANTMFKLTYQSFVMFSLAGAYIISRVLSSLKRGILRLLYLAPLAIFLTFIFIYPYYAIRSYYGLKNYKGLYGLKYLETSYSDDYRAVLWLKKNVAGQSVILEAVGESYTDFARVSANTGLPTVLGWRVHEWLWRGSFDEPGRRTEDVREIYESTDISKIKGLLSKYQVQLVFLGDLERKQYPKLQEKKFENLGETIFLSGKTKIYQLK